MNIENPISKTTENIIEEENTLKEKMKFIAMNRFKIVPNREKDFENIWKNLSLIHISEPTRPY